MQHGNAESQYQDTLADALAEVREAAVALRTGITPGHPDWSPAEQAAYEERFERWRRASKEIVIVLERLAGAQRNRLQRWR